MKAYELLFIIAPSTDEETRANTMNRIQGIITSAEGSVDNVDEWGKRKLAYVSTPSSISTLIPPRLQNSIACCASLMSLFAT